MLNLALGYRLRHDLESRLGRAYAKLRSYREAQRRRGLEIDSEVNADPRQKKARKSLDPSELNFF
jgi:hypothetical protein